MATINISMDIADNDLEAIRRVATKEGKTPLQYAEDVVRNAVKNALNGEYNRQYKRLTLAEKEAMFGNL